MIKSNAECLMSYKTTQLLEVISVDVNRINSPNKQRSNERKKSDNEYQNVMFCVIWRIFTIRDVLDGQLEPYEKQKDI